MNTPIPDCSVCGLAPKLREQFDVMTDRHRPLPDHSGWMIQVYPWAEGGPGQAAQREIVAICPTCAKRVAEFQKHCADNPRKERPGYGR